MHEFAIAQSLLETALAEAEKHHAKHIATLGIKLGKGSHITPDSLTICMKAVSKGTIAEKAKLEIQPIELHAKCRTCGRVFHMAPDEVPHCPECKGGNVHVESGDEVYLESMDIDEDTGYVPGDTV